MQKCHRHEHLAVKDQNLWLKALQERALLDKNCFTTEFLQICKEEDLPIIIIAKEWKKKNCQFIA